ncbi:hypothetical protein BKA67DRAFT_288271 [Truncatella angustata]|uniref:Uncharacterized protein n=1 Tax=Truncatella angustata TaxID=152316 RepID=A0A9P8UMK9_9PEZI|nr:uncharacterized protein BKA67DRAFT_288271 [Truncatella angustata]KAH6654727.1 hypothetical protein BKA67DRAFT_288271 [Truncatella angustata]
MQRAHHVSMLWNVASAGPRRSRLALFFRTRNTGHYRHHSTSYCLLRNREPMLIAVLSLSWVIMAYYSLECLSKMRAIGFGLGNYVFYDILNGAIHNINSMVNNQSWSRMVKIK